ncbi:MAG: enoyl-CoA hydratase/isomerase family protein [Kofleriaceae bacterium]
MERRVILQLHERLDDTCVTALARGLATAVKEGVRTIVLQGTADMFCLGMDFSVMSDPDPSERHRRLAGFADVMRALLTIPIPTLAVIDGPALGGGLGIAAACDYVLASDRARVGLPEALYGLAPAIIRPALSMRLSPSRLRMLIATCHSRDAHEAHQLGLVDEVVAVDELAAARTRALRQLRRADPATMAAIRRWDIAALNAQITIGLAETTFALDREEVRAAIKESAWA